MTARELLAVLHARGVRLRVQGDRIVYEAPPATLTPVHREALVSMRPEVLEILRADQANDWTRVNLWQLDRVLEVAVPWSDERLILAPGCRIARELRASDPKPGRVWCTCEVLDLLLSGVTPDDARRIAETRITFDATIESIKEAPIPTSDPRVNEGSRGRS